MAKQPDKALVHGLRDKVLLRQTYARLFPAEFAMAPKKQFNAPFLDSAVLNQQFAIDKIFDKTGLADNATMQSLQQRSRATKLNTYEQTHLQSALQTAQSLGIVHHVLVDAKPLERDPNLEQRYLREGGPVRKAV